LRGAAKGALIRAAASTPTFDSFAYMQGLDSIVKSFIADYYRWNEHANELSSPHSDEGRRKVAAEYTELLSRYCPPDVYRQGVAFGSPSSHAPDTETINNVTIEGDRAIVKTTNTDRSGLQADYEYLFVFSGERWFLEALDYVNDEGRYPCL
jgi:hypothetical protein